MLRRGDLQGSFDSYQAALKLLKPDDITLTAEVWVSLSYLEFERCNFADASKYGIDALGVFGVSVDDPNSESDAAAIVVRALIHQSRRTEAEAYVDKLGIKSEDVDIRTNADLALAEMKWYAMTGTQQKTSSGRLRRRPLVPKNNSARWKHGFCSRVLS